MASPGMASPACEPQLLTNENGNKGENKGKREGEREGEREEDENENGGIYISDESSFYGDEETRAGLEREVADFDPDSYTSQQLSLSAIAAAANKVTGKTPAASFKNTRERLLHNPLEGDPSGRQLAESIPDFLAHLPPQTTPTSEAGPWIRIANPFSRVRPLAQDLTAYAGAGARILEALGEAIAAQEAELLGRPQSLRNRKVTRLRKTATEDLLRLAQEHGVTTGKWMLFPSPAEVNAVWRLVADATVSEQLGHAAKVATDSGLGDGESRLVCVYTEDFANVGDVKRVLIKLAEMGLVNRKEAAGEPRGIYYKCDAFSHLGIDSKNEWGLKASLYASKDLLVKDGKLGKG